MDIRLLQFCKEKKQDPTSREQPKNEISATKILVRLRSFLRKLDKVLNEDFKSMTMAFDDLWDYFKHYLEEGKDGSVEWRYWKILWSLICSNEFAEKVQLLIERFEHYKTSVR